jgi:phage pi2 protein 07
LSNLLKEKGIDMLIMKGVSLSSLYPVPEDRPSCDLDIYTYGKHMQIYNLMHENGILVEKDYKHDTFNYENSFVELHKLFVAEHSKAGRIINSFLEKTSSLEKCNIEGGLLYPGTKFNTIFLLRHMCSHLVREKVTIKNLCDFALFLKKEYIHHILSVVKVITNASMVNAWNAFVALCADLFCQDYCYLYIGIPNKKLVKQLKEDILNDLSLIENEYNLIKRIQVKIKRILSRKWIFDNGLLPDNFWSEVVWGSLLEHVQRPSQI